MDKDCDRLGCYQDMANLRPIHLPGCRKFVAPDPQPVALDNHSRPVASIATARFAKKDDPNECGATDALHAAIDWCEEKENRDLVAHVVVFVAMGRPNGADGIKFFQAGTYRPHAQAGMVIEGLDVLRGSGWTEYGK